MWKKSGLKHTYTNLFRKSLVTKVYGKDPTQGENMAVLMDHCVATAQKNYNLKNKEVAAAEAATYADTLMFGASGTALYLTGKLKKISVSKIHEAVINVGFEVIITLRSFTHICESDLFRECLNTEGTKTFLDTDGLK